MKHDMSLQGKSWIAPTIGSLGLENKTVTVVEPLDLEKDGWWWDTPKPNDPQPPFWAIQIEGEDQQYKQSQEGIYRSLKAVQEAND